MIGLIKMFVFIAVVLAITAYSHESKAEVSYRLNIGLYSEHYLSDGDDLNENNNLVMLSRVKDGAILSAASFINSYNKQSYMVGYGRESAHSKDFRYGAILSVIRGYDGCISTHYKGYMAAPIAYMNYKGLALNIMPAAFNVGYEFDF